MSNPRAPMLLDSTGQAMVTKLEAIKTAIENGGGGGGTTVVANPSGSATVDLEKLQVGSTIYGISNSIADAEDVSLANLSNNQILKYNSTTQKWENASGGGGGASDLADLGDVAISTPTNGQVLTYNSTSQKWVNAAGGGGGVNYSETEQVIGTWIDGRDIYQVSIPFTNLNLSGNAYTSYNIASYLNNPDIVFVDHMMSYYIVNNVERLFENIMFENPNLLLRSTANRTGVYGHVTIRYVKQTT